jgi:putative NADH-flavin reductase
LAKKFIKITVFIRRITMKIVVIGATGTIGKSVSKKLLKENNHEVIEDVKRKKKKNKKKILIFEYLFFI